MVAYIPRAAFSLQKKKKKKERNKNSKALEKKKDSQNLCSLANLKQWAGEHSI